MPLFNANTRSVPISEIDTHDKTFLLRFARPVLPSLRDSISRFGILQPVLLGERPDGRFRIVHGFARLEAASEAGLTHVSVRIAEPDATDGDLLRVVILAHTMERGLNLVEEAMALECFVRIAGRDAALSEGLPLLGRKASPPVLDMLLSVLYLPERVRVALARGDVSDGIVHGLGAFDKSHRDILAITIVALRMSAGASRRFLREAHEVCRRDGVDPRELLDQLGGVPETEPASVPETREALLDALHRRRYPALTGLERKFARLANELELGERVRIYPPRDFEGERHRLEADLCNVEDFRELARRFDTCRTDKQDTLDDMFNLRCDEDSL